MITRCLVALVALLLQTPVVLAQTGNDLWIQTFKAIDFAATSRAGVKVGCRPESPLSNTPSYKQLCPRVDTVPDSVIEQAALPYLKQYLTEEIAHQAITFWSSERGRALTRKILREIETGVFNQLDAEDLKHLSTANQTAYGRALKSFASDRAQGRAVARAMLRYEP